MPLRRGTRRRARSRSATSSPSSRWASGTARCPRCAPARRTAIRVDGPWAPDEGLRFNPAKLLLDPYALAVTGDLVPEQPAFAHVLGAPEVRDDHDSAAHVPRSVVVDTGFDWEGDAPMRRRWRDTVIYEAHVKGLTALHDRVPEHLRGTYAGLADPAVTDYLRDLGVTAVELLPVHQFVSEPSLTERGATNYWGYNSIGYFAPHAAYSSSGERGQQVREFKEMVQGAAPRRPRGDPRRRLQPHRRGGPTRADAELPRPRRPRLLQARGADGRPARPARRSSTTPTGTSPAAATPSTPTTRWRCG